MIGRLAHIAGQEQVGAFHLTRVHCPDLAEVLRPGHFVLVRFASTWDPYLRIPLFPVVIDPLSWLVYHRLEDAQGLSLLHRSPPGTQVMVWGPLGQPFPSVSPGDRVLVLAQEPYVPYVLGLARDLSVQHDVVMLVEHGGGLLPTDLHWLPPAVEFQTVPSSGAHLDDALSALSSWADKVFVAGPAHWPQYIAYRLETLWMTLPRGRAFALVADGIMCGLGLCDRCVLSTRRGPIRTCRKGPVLDLGEWFGTRRGT